MILENLCKAYNDTKVLKDINYKFYNNKITAILGPSGCGKTTLLNIISGLEKATSGKITVNTRNISYMFQEDRLIPWLSVYENVAFVLKSNYKKPKINGLVRKYLELVDLKEYAYETIDKLSGGMKRRVSMARALAYDSELLLLDEPFKGMDDELKMNIISKFLSKWKDNKNTVIFVTHDEKEVKELAQVTFRLAKCK
ncbi:ABC transporter ATP-binding protein [Haloimpatiens sp. FM7315]|uniref:ABC transporter ATP-binding protein n=1 Tax=Haloimpatiens sp. FM7315 TaxID=3298609 RepID=UPI0035A2B075